jgi:anti-sigma regulatory factor (Ser/Thr protein kinase)
MTAQALVRADLLDVERRSVRALQRSLLPQALPVVDGVLTAVRYVASDREALVGGDWYDVVPLAGGAVALVLGDVEGHDLEAAALMGLVRSAVRAYAMEGHPPAVVLERANTFLAGLSLGRIVTLTFAQLHPLELLITTVSAGHPPTLVVAPDGTVTEVPSQIGPPLGVQEDGLHWLETTSQLPEHGVFAMFSDGLVEVRGEDLDEGLARVKETLVATRHEAPAEVAEALLARRGDSHDDVALLVSRLTATAGAGRRVTRRLPARSASVFLARRYARQLLQAWQLPSGLVERTELVVSELVTNAARHSEEDLELTLEVTTALLRVEVADTSHRVPDAVVRSPTDDATSGRGLLLVEAVASRWGVESEGLSKVVWAELDL